MANDNNPSPWDSLAAKTIHEHSAKWWKESIDRIRIKVLLSDPITLPFSHDAHRNITNEKATTAKLTIAVDALKDDAPPWKASTDVGDVPLVTLADLV